MRIPRGYGQRSWPTLEERLAAADHLSATNPKQAATMYHAILDLYGGEAWAAPVVEKGAQQPHCIGEKLAR